MDGRHVFLDKAMRPYMVMPWGEEEKPWLFYWHSEGHWTTLREVEKDEEFPQNLSEDQQTFYDKAQKQWESR